MELLSSDVAVEGGVNVGDMSIEDIIFDLYLVMKFKGYVRLTLSVDSSMILENVSAYELPLPERSKNAFIKKKIVNLGEISKFIKDKKKINALRGYGTSAQADTKNAILSWWINYNMTHGRHPLFGVRLERI